MQNLRASVILVAYLLFTLPLMPVQALLLRLSTPAARAFPHWYHRKVCRLFNVRLHVLGAPVAQSPVLFVSNHVSWLDISVLSAFAPVSFIAKSEVADWPWAGWLAKLQRTVFVDRQSRAAVEGVNREIARRLRSGDRIVLFAEGTSNDGNRVLPFRTALFAAAMPGNGGDGGAAPDITMQTLAIAYTHVHGVPMGRRGRPRVAWYGAMEMASHVWELLRYGPLDIRIRVGPPVLLDGIASRKELARSTEHEIRAAVARLLVPRKIRQSADNAAPHGAPVDGLPYIE